MHHDCTIAVRRDVLDHPLVSQNSGSKGLGKLNLNANALFRPNVTGARFKTSDCPVANEKLRESATDSCGIELFVRNSEFLRRSDRRGYESGLVVHRHVRIVLGHNQTSNRKEQLTPRTTLQLSPYLMRAERKRHVELSLTDSLASDAGSTV
jgi:hypothetical protein